MRFGAQALDIGLTFHPYLGGPILSFHQIGWLFFAMAISGMGETFARGSAGCGGAITRLTGCQKLERTLHETAERGRHYVKPAGAAYVFGRAMSELTRSELQKRFSGRSASLDSWTTDFIFSMIAMSTLTTLLAEKRSALSAMHGWGAL